MGLTDWMETTKEWVGSEGAAGFLYALNQLHTGFVRQATSFVADGTNVYERDWDVLLILDGCRVDALAETREDYSFLDEPGIHRSTASTSWEWMETTFLSKYLNEIGKTVYVTANQHSDSIKNKPFVSFEPVYEYGWEETIRTYPADLVTDAAIESARENTWDRMIVHYMQPHFPSVPKPIGHGDKFDNVWKRLIIGKGDKTQLWDSYIANLRYVLDSVEKLLRNIDAETVVISSDHGNAMGEWWIYGHPHGMPLKSLREVPWYTTSASDNKTRTPNLDELRSKEDTAPVDDRLRALGYRI